MRPYVEPVWGWDEVIQSKGFDGQLGAENFKIFSIDGIDVGGYCLKPKADSYWLDMLLVEPTHQSSGIGKRIMAHIQSRAESEALPIRLCSIKTNPATNFYKHLGYTEYKQDATLIYLEKKQTHPE